MTYSIIVTGIVPLQMLQLCDQRPSITTSSPPTMTDDIRAANFGQEDASRISQW